jgi:uncharacterized membrane protein
MQVLVEWLHIASGILWVGGYAFATFIVWPALLKRPAPEAIAMFDTINKPISTLLGGSAQGVFWLGLIRGTVYGPIKSFDVLTQTPYGHAFMGAIVVTIVAIVISAVSASRLRDTVFEGDSFRSGGGKKVLRTNYLVIGLFALVLGFMVTMGHGA